MRNISTALIFCVWIGSEITEIVWHLEFWNGWHEFGGVNRDIVVVFLEYFWLKCPESLLCSTTQAVKILLRHLWETF